MEGNTISVWVANLDIWPLVVMLVPYFFVFRRYGKEVHSKRLASLYHALLVFGVTSAAALVVALDLTDAYFAAAAGALAIASIVLRKHLFPYRLSCPQCGRAYDLFSSDIRVVYVMDDHLCDSCRSAARTP